MMIQRARRYLAPMVLLTAWILSAPARADRSGTVEDRTRDITTIERLRWERRIWPSENLAPRPSFEFALPESVLRERAEDVLRMTAALSQRYGRTVTSEDLRLELLRMARGTKDPGALRAMFAVLGGDPRRIAETIARPVVVDRLLRSAFAADATIHGPANARARSALANALGEPSCPEGAQCRPLELHRGMEDRRSDSIGMSIGEWNELVIALSRGALSREGFSSRWLSRGRLRHGRYSNLRGALDALKLGRWSPLEDAENAYIAWRIEAKEADALRLTVASWPKPGFETWWATRRRSFAASPVELADPGALPEVPASGGCTADTWSPMDPELPGSRVFHTAVWDGSEMIVWGGIEAAVLGDGWKYSPATDSWSRITSAGAPSPRSGHVAVWTGTEMIVWGGDYALPNGTGDPGTGGRYNPVTDTWSSTSTSNAPLWRDGTTAVWTGSQVIVWGGDTGSGPGQDGGRYSPSTNTWTPTSLSGAPEARVNHTAVWTGSQMIVWGGRDTDGVALDSGGRYDPAHDHWTSTTLTSAPDGRYLHTAVWTGSEMIVWGGYDVNGADLGSGGRYDLSRNRWTQVATIGAPTARDSHSAIWSGTRMVIWGGFDFSGLTSSGGRYDPSTNTWLGVTSAGAPSSSGSQTAVWTGSRMITFGGWAHYGISHGGGRYDPGSDSWTGMATAWRPGARMRHAATWTGNEMIMWGGYPGGVVPQLDAGRYEPGTDTWTPIAMSGAPTDRWDPSAVWTGTQMIVWGGGQLDPQTGSEISSNGGGRYDPALNAWLPMAALGEPSPRRNHSTVWTGSEMIVWGGEAGQGALGDGGRYLPSMDTWSPVLAQGAPSARTQHVAVWTGREMIVAEGKSNHTMVDPGGGRYNPARDRWARNSDTGAQRRINGRPVWSGHEMIVAFGQDESLAMNTGERYNPETNTWSAIAPCDAGLFSPGALWTCGRMLVWGDDPAILNMTGEGRFFDPASNQWSSIGLVDSPLGCEYVKPVGDGTRLITFGGAGPSSAGYQSDSGGTYCACSTQAPLRTPEIFLDKVSAGDRISWYLLPEAAYYDIVRGDVEILRSTGGDFAAATTACVANDVAGSSIIDPTEPAPGRILWYVARSARPGEAGTYDSGSPQQAGSRDPGIAASGQGCP